MMQQLERCPKCGSEQIKVLETGHNPYKCKKCGHRWGSDKQEISKEDVGNVSDIFGKKGLR